MTKKNNIKKNLKNLKKCNPTHEKILLIILFLIIIIFSMIIIFKINKKD
jgi:hypothetical protein